MAIYSPSDDSYLLAESIKKYLKNKNKKISILDMGSGSGIQAETCRKLGFENVTAADIDKEVVSFLKEKHFKAVESNLFSAFKGRLNVKGNPVPLRFDLIIFNPPYLPEDKYDKEKDTSGGKEGFETILKFLKQAKTHLKKEGRIMLLFSSFSNPEKIKKEAGKLNYKMSLIARKKLFFEELFVYMLR